MLSVVREAASHKRPIKDLVALACCCGSPVSQLHVMCCYQVDPSAWAGSTLSDAHAAAHQDQKQQQNHQQRNSLQQSLCLVQKQAFSVLGLGLSVWDCEQQLSSVAKVHFASHRGGDGLYGGYYGGR